MKALPNIPTVYLVLGGLAAVAVLVVLSKPRAVGQAVGGAAGNLAGGVIEGAAQAVIGLPPTDEAKCDACIAAGDFWGASVACPAGRFLSAVTAGKFNAKGPERDASNGLSRTVTHDVGQAAPDDWLSRVLVPGA